GGASTRRTASRSDEAVEALITSASTGFSGTKPAMVSETPLLELREISKSFGSVQALTECVCEVRTGEGMALVGDNGAGNSTLIKCVAGTHTPDSGEIVFEGEEVHIH